MNEIAPRSDPGSANAERGVVILDGPDGVAVAMTPAAAAETGRRLIAAADEAIRTGAADPAGEGDEL